MNPLKNYLFIVLGSALSAFGISCFLARGHIAAGGASGVAIVLNSLLSIPISVTVISVNIILFIVGYRILKKSAIIKTLFSTILLSVLIEVFSYVPFLTDDILLSCAYGGVLVGAGTGMVISGGASTGGSDFAAVLLHKSFYHISVAKLLLIIDLSIVLISGAAFGDFGIMLYAIIALFIASKSAEFIIEGLNFSKLVFIISDKNDDITVYIINELRRGVTSFKAKGEYSGEEKKVLLCAVSPVQFPELKSYVLSKDKNAFIILSDARSVFGEGFNME